MKAYGFFTAFTLLISLSLAAPAQKSRRVLREDLSVQTSVPVGGGTAGETSPELHGTGLAPVSPVPGTLTAATGPTGSAQDTSAALLSAGRGVVIPGTVTAATAVTAITTVSNDQNMLPALLSSILGGLSGMGGNNAKAGTGTTKSNANTSTPSSSASSDAPSNSVPANNNATPSQGTLSQAPQQDAPSSKRCDEYKAKYKDKVEPPLHEKYKIKECIGADAKNPTQLKLKAKDADKPSNIYPVASGKVVEAGPDHSYGCRVVILHEKCPFASVNPNGPCKTSYLKLAMDPDKKECPDPKLNLKVGQQVTTQTVLGQTSRKNDKKDYKTRFEVLLGNQGVHPDKYLCAFTSHPNAKSSRGESQCAKPNNEQGANTILSVPDPDKGVQ